MQIHLRLVNFETWCGLDLTADLVRLGHSDTNDRTKVTCPMCKSRAGMLPTIHADEIFADGIN